MLHFVRRTADDRRLRLLICACCRLVWPHLRDARSRRAVEAGERYADGLLGTEALEAAFRASDRPSVILQRHNRKRRDYLITPGLAAAIAARIPCWPANGFIENCRVGVEQALAALEALGPAARPPLDALVRDIFGNPFRPSTPLDRAWLGPTVVGLANAAYEHRTLPSAELALEADRLAVLSDALEESGCGDAPLLEHLRSPGPHVRGCWAVDRCLRRDE
jgi:hypothetical protein